MTLKRHPSIDEHIRELLSEETSDKRRAEIFTDIQQTPMTPHTIVETARVVRDMMIPLALKGSPIDTCGTGGSQKQRINTSTIVAFIVGATGGKVAKHGNRAISGSCGSFDLLEGLGINILLHTKSARAVYDELGIVFLYAPLFHPSLKRIGSLRKTYRKPTIFNLIGPLCNPASIKKHIIGTPTKSKQDLLSSALMTLGAETAVIISGNDGLDEVTLSGFSQISYIPGNHTRVFHPRELGLNPCTPEELLGGSIEDNVAIARNILSGKDTSPRRDLVLINASFALQVSLGIEDLNVAFHLASDTLASGKAYELMKRYLEASHDLA